MELAFSAERVSPLPTCVAVCCPETEGEREGKSSRKQVSGFQSLNSACFCAEGGDGAAGWQVAAETTGDENVNNFT